MRFCLLWLLVLLMGCTPLTPSSEPESPFYAPDFTLQTLNGESVTLSDYRDEWVIINFWATWCAPCREEMPVLQMIYEDYPNLTVLAINQRESAAVIQPFVDEFALTFPILVQPDNQVLMNYQVTGLPQTLIIRPNGEVAARQFGMLDLKRVADALNS